MAHHVELPPILLRLTSNVVTAVGLPVLLGMASGLPTRKVVRGRWYNSLSFPPGRPPGWAFPVVWTTLYASMGYASYLATVALQSADAVDRPRAYKGLVLYWSQLALNMAWSPLFFVAKQTGWALLEIGALTALVGNMTVALHGPTGGRSTWLLAPYCAWLGLASYLNAGIFVLNRNRHVSKQD